MTPPVLVLKKYIPKYLLVEMHYVYKFIFKHFEKKRDRCNEKKCGKKFSICGL
jgi:hypothetical protein